VEAVLASSAHADESAAAAAQLNAARAALQLPALDVGCIDRRPADPGRDRSPLTTTHARVLGDWDGPLQFGAVAVGGTFDRLHAGHRLLLGASALVATRAVFVGVTADQMLAAKKNASLLEPYAAREAGAVDFMRRVHPGLRCSAGPLSDPRVPPLCATERDFDAIVVSEETIHGADAINAVRAGLGFPPLVVVVVGLVASSAASHAKLSSTDLRAVEAAGGGGS
jgi:pantetheine-phosphate adenylyltransferase